MPLRTDGSKSPVGSWRHLIDERPSWDAVANVFAGPPQGIGIICGLTSGNLEVLDFDDYSVFPKWSELVKDAFPSLLATLPIVATPSRGVHIYWRCSTIEGNQVLARDSTNVLIETRGQGGLVVAPGSPLATHPTGKPYTLACGSLTPVPTIEPEQRNALLDFARSLNRYVAPAIEGKASVVEFVGDDAGDRPGDVFNRNADWHQILEPKGWTLIRQRGGIGYWNKPNSTNSKEHHATTGYGGVDALYVFSTALAGLEAGRSYNKFAVYALLYHDGDFSRAAHAISQYLFQNPKGV